MARSLFLLGALITLTAAFHDCIQPALGKRLPPGLEHLYPAPPANCSGGLCVGMHGGPHEGGPAAYPVGDAQKGFTTVTSTFTVPEMPQKQDGICYYIWTDIFFGDMSYGRMNQFVPQLILGNALDGSSGPPEYKPKWGLHTTWSFGAHYFFETYNATSNSTEGHAAYGELYPAKAGEELYIEFKATQKAGGPSWTLTMGAVNDKSRTSVVVVDKPYMGLGVDWPIPTTSWSEKNYTNMCVNSCWELYGANDRAHLPGNGSNYVIKIDRGDKGLTFPWVTQWDEDEGKGSTCASSKITESHNDTVQLINWEIGF